MDVMTHYKNKAFYYFSLKHVVWIQNLFIEKNIYCNCIYISKNSFKKKITLIYWKYFQIQSNSNNENIFDIYLLF